MSPPIKQQVLQMETERKRMAYKFQSQSVRFRSMFKTEPSEKIQPSGLPPQKQVSRLSASQDAAFTNMRFY